jgi:uncharacterized membrane protein HdeD (DUF308 family)
MADERSLADLDAAVAEARRQISEHWGWFMGLGCALVLAGVVAIAFPFISTLATELALGSILLAGGVLLVIHAFSASGWRGFLLGLLLGALYLLAGAWLVLAPGPGILGLTVLLCALFIAEGILEGVMALRVRPHEGWGWLLASGLVAIAVGLLIGIQLPSSAAWALGLLTGINLLSTGASFIALALAGRRVAATAVVA